MAAAEIFAAPRHIASGIDTLTAEDFETASIRSAAPSYVSEAPSYHSNPPESLPPYTPSTTDLPRTATTGNTSTTARSTSTNTPSSRPSAPPRAQSHAQRRTRGGLPPVPTTPLPVPSLNAFAIPSWSTFSANPTTRHYHSVAQRRVAAANNRVGSSQLRNYLLDSVVEEDSGGGLRYMEDPYVVGEEAAREARGERLRRERDEQLRVENRRWDWYISQMNVWQEQERTLARFRRQPDNEERKSFMRRVSGRLF